MRSLTNLLLLPLAISTHLIASVHAQQNAVQSGGQVLIYAWPVAASSPQELAKIGYVPDANHAIVKRFTPPSTSSSDDLVRVGLYDPKTSDWKGVVTAASSFDKKYQQKIELHVDDRAQVWHVGFTAHPKPKPAKGTSTGNQKAAIPQVIVEIVRPAPGPTPHLNSPVTLTPDGKVQDKEEEKSFLQKYWWAIALFVLVQLVMGGGGGADK